MMNPETAHFFWHGRPLSVYERACMASFVRQGFAVNLWCFDALNVPAGIVRRDAAEILPRSDLGKYTQGGMKANITAFSDAFRFTLLSKEPGWWFDCDVVCLRQSADFTALAAGKNIVCGREDRKTISVGVLHIPDTSLQHDLLEELATSGTDFPWAYIGPSLLTRVLTRLNLQSVAQPPQAFYPVSYLAPLLALHPDKIAEIQRLCQGAYTYHLWNEILRRLAIPKNILPPEGSWLHQEFIKALPEAAHLPCLEVSTLNALTPLPSVKRRVKEVILGILNLIESTFQKR